MFKQHVTKQQVQVSLKERCEWLSLTAAELSTKYSLGLKFQNSAWLTAKPAKPKAKISTGTSLDHNKIMTALL